MKIVLVYSILISILVLWFATLYAMLTSSNTFLMSMGAFFGTFTLTILYSVGSNFIKDRT